MSPALAGGFFTSEPPEKPSKALVGEAVLNLGFAGCVEVCQSPRGKRSPERGKGLCSTNGLKNWRRWKFLGVSGV